MKELEFLTARAAVVHVKTGIAIFGEEQAHIRIVVQVMKLLTAFDLIHSSMQCQCIVLKLYDSLQCQGV